MNDLKGNIQPSPNPAVLMYSKERRHDPGNPDRESACSATAGGLNKNVLLLWWKAQIGIPMYHSLSQFAVSPIKNGKRGRATTIREYVCECAVGDLKVSAESG